MKRRVIGHSSVTVTELGFGAASIGNLYTAISDEDALATVGAAWDSGMRYFDNRAALRSWAV